MASTCVAKKWGANFNSLQINGLQNPVEDSGNAVGERQVTMVAMSDDEPSVPANPVLSVSGLNRLVRDCLEAAFPLTWVGGEISNLAFAASGHVYFSLKDASAQVRCVMWRNRAQLLGWRPENGQQVEARAMASSCVAP